MDDSSRDSTLKADLQRYLQTGREAMLWKLEGLSEYDARRPLTPTGTNLLGLVKHLGAVEAGYFGVVFDRPFPEPFEDGAEDNGDLWARADESRGDVTGFYRRVWAHADETVSRLPLDAEGSVPWWAPERRRVTLHRILVHVATETHRHAGHADIVRELVDGTVGLRPGGDNMPSDDPAWFDRYRARVEEAAQQAAQQTAQQTAQQAGH